MGIDGKYGRDDTGLIEGLRQLRAFFRNAPDGRIIGQIVWLGVLAAFVAGILAGSMLTVVLHG